MNNNPNLNTRESRARLYISYAIDTADNTTQQITLFTEALRRTDYDILSYRPTINSTNKELYEWHVDQAVHDCDVMIAICDKPTIDIGWRIGVATKLGKPVVMLVRKNIPVNPLVLGAIEAKPFLHLIRYSDLIDTLQEIDEIVVGERLFLSNGGTDNYDVPGQQTGDTQGPPLQAN